MRVEFGEIKIEFPYERYLGEFIRRKNPFETMFPKFNPGSFNELFNMNPSNMANYFKEITRMMEKLSKASKPKT